MRSWNHLLPFITVMREGSFRRAAGRVGVTPAAISQSIAQLERELGVRLFHRTTRQLHPTDEGQRLFDVIGDLVEELDYNLRGLDHLRGEPVGLIRVWLASAFGRQRVIPVIAPFLEQYPNISIDFNFDNFASGVVQNGFDLIVRHGAGNDGYVSRLLCEMKLILIASPQYVARKSLPRSLSELVEHDQIIARAPSGILFHWKRPRDAGEGCGEDADIVSHPKPKVVVTGSTDAVRDAALAHLGIGAIFADYVLEELKTGTLIQVLPNEKIRIAEPSDASVYIQYPSRAHLPMRTRLLVDHLVREIATRS